MLSRELDSIYYPRYWFLSLVVGACLIVALLDLIAYKTFYNIQLHKSNNLLSVVTNHFNQDVELIAHSLIKLSKKPEITKNSAEQLKNALLSDFTSSKLAISPTFNNEYNKIFADLEFFNLEQLRADSLFKETTIAGHRFKTQLGYTNQLELKLFPKTLYSQSKKNLELSVNLQPLITEALKANSSPKYKNFIVKFKFDVANSHLKYTQTLLSQFIVNLNEDVTASFKPASLNTSQFNFIKSAHVIGDMGLVDVRLKHTAVQNFLRDLIVLSLIVLLIAILLANYLYKRLYHLEKYNLKLVRDRKLFQQQAEMTLASIYDGVILTNSTAQITYINNTIERHINLKATQVYFKTVSEIIPELAILENNSKSHIRINNVKIQLPLQVNYFDIQAIKLYNENGVYIGNAICLHDITEMKDAEQKINYLAFFDELTGLGNKLCLLDYYNTTVKNLNEDTTEEYKLITIAVNIQSLKNINDTIGYENGERTLLALVKSLQAHLCSINLADNLYRISEDTLAIAFVYNKSIYGKSSILFITNLINQLAMELNRPINLAQQNIYLQFNFGVSIFPDNFTLPVTSDLALLLRYAEIAMSAARRKGVGKFVFYSEAIDLSIREKFHLENELRHAIHDNELELLFHPQVHIQNQKLRGFEILVRWKRNDDRIILPGTFIPLLEKSGLIVAVGDWILHEACMQALQLLKQGIDFETLSVNISGLQLQTENFIDRLTNILTATQFPREKLELEITENVFFDNPKFIINTLEKLRQQGIKIALDDFGSGFSSLNYLKNLPLDCLKIDKEFVQEIQTGDTRLLEAILAIAKTMNLLSVAEGVETAEEVDFLRENLCDIIQGYYISKPLPVEVVITKFSSDSKS